MRTWERIFWKETFDNAPASIQEIIKSNFDTLQISLTIGVIIDRLYLKDSAVFDEPSIRALLKLLT